LKPTRPGRLEEICKQCGRIFTTWECKKKRGNGKFCSRECAAKHQSENYTDEKRRAVVDRLGKRGPEHPSWRGGRKIQNGYVHIWNADHPDADRHGYISEHRLVMEQHLGGRLLPTEIVHHKDGNKQNNAIENLELCSSQIEHMAHHMIEKYGGRQSKTKWATIWDACTQCGTTETPHQAKGLCRKCYMKRWVNTLRTTVQPI
jgi:hypothetical protein